jgi:uncharacterized protein YegP (UPF0339 family)
MTEKFAMKVLFVLVAGSVGIGCATSGDEGGEYFDAESSATAPGTVDLWQSSDSQWRFHVVSGNGRILLASEGYATRTGAIGGVLSVFDNGVDPARYQPYLTASGQYNLHLLAGNNEIIAHTETYASKSNATRAIDACVRAITSHLGSVANSSAARVEVVEDSAGVYHFALRAGNDELLLVSDPYTTRAAAFNGGFALQDAATRDDAFSILTSASDEYYFTVRATNGEALGTSELYSSGTAAAVGITTTRSIMADLDLL